MWLAFCLSSSLIWSLSWSLPTFIYNVSHKLETASDDKYTILHAEKQTWGIDFNTISNWVIDTCSVVGEHPHVAVSSERLYTECCTSLTLSGGLPTRCCACFAMMARGLFHSIHSSRPTILSWVYKYSLFFVPLCLFSPAASTELIPHLISSTLLRDLLSFTSSLILFSSLPFEDSLVSIFVWNHSQTSPSHPHVFVLESIVLVELRDLVLHSTTSSSEFYCVRTCR